MYHSVRTRLHIEVLENRWTPDATLGINPGAIDPPAVEETVPAVIVPDTPAVNESQTVPSVSVGDDQIVGATTITLTADSEQTPDVPPTTVSADAWVDTDATVFVDTTGEPSITPDVNHYETADVTVNDTVLVNVDNPPPEEA